MDYMGHHESLLDWLYETADNHLVGTSIRPFLAENDLSLEEGFDLVRYAAGNWMAEDKSTMGDPAARLTPEGISWAEGRRRRRDDPAARVSAARSGLLTWLWHQRHRESSAPVAVLQVMDSPQAIFEGARLTDREFERAAAYLHEKGLIRGISVDQIEGPALAEITPDGEDCVENYDGDLSAYERRNTGTTINIGSNTGNIAANSRDITMNATTTTHGISLADVVLLARAVRQAAPVLGLPESEVEELADYANRMEEEASGGSPDTGRLRRWGASTVALLNSPTVSGALGGVLAAYAGTVLPGLPG